MDRTGLNVKIQRSRDAFIREKKQQIEMAGQNGPEGLHQLPQVAGLDTFQYPFENLVFEGGGSKGVAYCGAIKALEDYGIMQNIKRVAGSSAGGMTAALLAINCTSGDIQKYLGQNLKKIVLDHSWGCLSLLPNVLCSYGWNPGDKIYDWFGETFRKRTGNADITFSEVHERYGKELCIVVTNVNTMEVEYFSPRTTPRIAVRLAVRMTMALPVLFQPVPLQRNGKTDYYVDGGVLCNYPIHCYDGDWLTFTPDSLLKQVGVGKGLLKDNERFGTFNDATLGFLVYADNERDIFQKELKKRANKFTALPDTRLAKKKIRKKKILDEMESEHTKTENAVRTFLKNLPKPDQNSEFDKVDVEEAFRKLLQVDFHYLCGEDVNAKDAADALDIGKNGKISHKELFQFVEANWLSLQECCLSYQRQDVTGFASFLSALENSISTHLKRQYADKDDIKRTVGINTGHIGTADFSLEKEDIDYAVEQGRRSTEAFLEEFVNNQMGQIG